MTPIALAIPALLEKLFGVVDKVIPDKDAAQKAKDALAAAGQDQDFQLALQQILVNMEEAKSENWFVAGWRPACGWIGAFGLAYAAILEPFARFVAKVWFGYAGAFPAVDTSITMQILFGILGLGAYRAYEKVKQVAR